jgi:DNA replication and repair protein RecF
MIVSAKLILSSGINVVIGKNGSGKSSIIEAFSILSTGRSFRTRHISEVIHWKSNTLLITSRLLHLNKTSHIGIEKTQSETRIRINQCDIHSQAELSQYIPITIITPDSIKLIMGAPSERRSYIDWIGFYLLPEYHQLWKQHQRILKQRNACLKSKRITADFDFWTRELIDIQWQLHEKRQTLFLLLQESTEVFREILLPDHALSLSLTYGFPPAITFKAGNSVDFYKSKLAQEIKLKRTMYGVHKSDLKIYINDNLAHISASRGQLKLLSILLHLAQSHVLMKKEINSGMIVIDDVASELDETNQHILFEALKSLQQQVILTLPEQSTVWNEKKFTMFHVKHGELTKVSE